MKPLFFKTLWGHSGTISGAARRAVDDSFDGIEGPCPADRDRRAEFIEALGSRKLLYIAEISTTGFAVPEAGTSIGAHLDAFERAIAASLPAEPLIFTAMAGNDLWTTSENIRFLREASSVAQRYGVRVGFETHRSRSLFHPLVAREILSELPDLELTVDFSHWCNVCERLVMDEVPEILGLCAGRVLHIHLRIGYDQGAQVPDPASPRHRDAFEAHRRWWNVLWDGQRQRGFTQCTMTPEFGPDGYQQIDARTGLPHGDLDAFNGWMAREIRACFPAAGDLARKSLGKGITK